MPAIDFDTIMRIAMPVGVLLLFIGVGYMWNNKYRPAQLAKGIATDKFSGSFSRLIRFIFREDKSLLFPKLEAKKAKRIEAMTTVEKAEHSRKNKINFDKFLTYNTLYMVLLIVFALMVAGLPTYSWVPLIIVVLLVMARAPKVLKERQKTLVRMATVANKTFGFGRDAEKNPWGYVNVKKWLGYTTPGETVIKFSASWMATEAGKDTFENHFTQTITEENSWNFAWDSVKGTVTCTPVTHMPTFVAYEGSKDWDKIPIGIGIDGEVVWDIGFSPHILVAGKTGSGKSVVQRNMMFHAIQHNDKWCILGIDPKRVELGAYKKYKKTVIGIATELEDEVTVLRYALEEMDNRYRNMEAIGVNNIANMPDRPRNIMVMVDEAYQLMATDSSAKTDAAKEANNLHGEASDIIGKIARLGRAAGVHLVLAMQRPDAVVLKGEIKANIDARIAAGRLDSTPSSMILDSGAATRLPPIKGRGVARLGKDMEVYQGYFAEQDWIDHWLAKPENQWREPEVVAELMENMPVSEEMKAELAATSNEDSKVDFSRMDDSQDFTNNPVEDTPRYEEPETETPVEEQKTVETPTPVAQPRPQEPIPSLDQLVKQPTPDLSYQGEPKEKPLLKRNPQPETPVESVKPVVETVVEPTPVSEVAPQPVAPAPVEDTEVSLPPSRPVGLPPARPAGLPPRPATPAKPTLNIDDGFSL